MSPPIWLATERGVLAAAAAAIRAGQLVALPTETVYGICGALDQAALERLVATKGRDETKGLTLLVDGLAQARRLAVIPPAARRLAAAFWPGPLTLVLPLRPDVSLPDLVTGGRRTAGFRVPAMAVPRGLARRLGPLPLTSANRSGLPDAVDAQAVVSQLGDALGLIIDGGPSPGGVPSTVVAVSADPAEQPAILRLGALSAAQIAAALA
ncbi:MAG: L-threonylcarbamoyladenylate synthase [Candidatus Limnocylindrales bacterium]